MGANMFSGMDISTITTSTQGGGGGGVTTGQQQSNDGNKAMILVHKNREILDKRYR